MVKATKINKEDIGVVYDISLDGTVVNALGMNVRTLTCPKRPRLVWLESTSLKIIDGFNFS